MTPFFEALAHHLVWLSTPDGQPVYHNRAFREYTGLTRLDTSWRESLVHADDLERLREEWDTAFREHRAFSDVCRLRRHDGTWHWFVDGIAPLGSEPPATHFVGTLTNVHTLKVAHEALTVLGHELRSPLQALKQALYVQNLPGIGAAESAQMRDNANRQVQEIARLCDVAARLCGLVT